MFDGVMDHHWYRYSLPGQHINRQLMSSQLPEESMWSQHWVKSLLILDILLTEQPKLLLLLALKLGHHHRLLLHCYFLCFIWEKATLLENDKEKAMIYFHYLN